MRDQFEQAGVQLIAISADAAHDTATFGKKEGIVIPLLSDPELKVIGAYGLIHKDNDISLPATVIIDQTGNIRWQYVGKTMMDRADAMTLLKVAGEL